MNKISNTGFNFYTVQPNFTSRMTSPSKYLTTNFNNLFKKVENTKDFEDFFNTINREIGKMSNVEQIDSNTFKLGEYYIKTGIETDIEFAKFLYNSLREKGINIAPEYIGGASSKEGFSIYVLKNAGTTSGNLINYEQGKNLISEASKKDIYAQIQKLAKLGLVNKEALNGNGLKITPDDKRVIIDQWQNLSPIEEMGISRKEYLNKMHTKIFK